MRVGVQRQPHRLPVGQGRPIGVGAAHSGADRCRRPATAAPVVRPGDRGRRHHCASLRLRSIRRGGRSGGRVDAVGSCRARWIDRGQGRAVRDEPWRSDWPIIRLASLGSLPLIGIADRFGRRRVILAVTMAGLALTAAAAASPGYWWFVAIFAFGRPLLSATNALAEVMAAEETAARDRTAAIALIAAGYAAGAGLSAIVHSLAAGALGFRGIFALALVPLAVVYALRSWVEEPNRFTVAQATGDHPTPVLGAVGPRYRRRVIILCSHLLRHLDRDGSGQQLRVPLRTGRPAPGRLRDGADGRGRWHLGRARPARGPMAWRPDRPATDLQPRHGRHRADADVRLLGRRRARSSPGTSWARSAVGSSRRHSAPCSPSSSRRPSGRR